VSPQDPFQPQDLACLDVQLLDKAYAVREMAWIAAGVTSNHVIGLRHDLDNILEPAVDFAMWEAERGYKATYFVLHGTAYWDDKRLLRESLEVIAEHGHEIGLHNNALAEASTTGQDPRAILAGALDELRGYGFDVRGTVAHGDSRCYSGGKLAFVNDEMFRECGRGNDRAVCSLKDFGLDYDASWLPRGSYLSESGGRWSAPFDEFAAGFPYDGQTHVLLHPCWWVQAFAAQEIAA